MTAVPKTYDKGDTIRLGAQFYDEVGVLADPTDVELKIRNPIGSVSTPTVLRMSTGVYYYDLTTSISDPHGRWEYRFEGTGAVTSAEEAAFFLRRSDFS